MTIPDLIFLALVLGLPIAVSFRLFRNEPDGRPFVATYVLAVIGSSISFGLIALLLTIFPIGGLGLFDGVFALIASMPIALIIGLIVRHQRKSVAS
jgi:hypothetical protein